MKRKAKCLQLLCILLGNLMLALGVTAFSLPHSLALTGVNGAARNLQHFFGMNLTISIACINLLTFLLGFWFLGKDFALNTIVSTILYPFLFNLMLKIELLKTLTSDRFMASILAGVLLGAGMGIIMRAGGSSGGMDIPPLILNRKFRWPVALTLNVTEAVGLLLQLTYSDSDQILYGIMSTIVTSFVLNQILLYGDENIQVMIISEEFEKVNTLIQTALVHGTTLIPIETGHLHNSGKAILSVLSSRDLNQLNRTVQEIDEEAFVIVTKAREVRGLGFTLDRNRSS